MVTLGKTSTLVEGTGYKLEYEITQNFSLYEPLDIEEYGMRCMLYGESEEMLDMEEIKCITPNFRKIRELFRLITGYQVFPVHLKEVVSDLLEVQA